MVFLLLKHKEFSHQEKKAEKINSNDLSIGWLNMNDIRKFFNTVHKFCKFLDKLPILPYTMHEDVEELHDLLRYFLTDIREGN